MLACRSKYKAKKVTIDGITFDSQKEGKRYRELSLLARVGKITDLQTQVKFVLIPSQYAEKGNAFSKHGKPVQSYICTLEDAQAEFLLREILKHQTGRDVIDVILLA